MSDYNEDAFTNNVISPRIIYWLHVPQFIDADEKFKFLEYDIFIREYNCSINDFFNIISSQTSVFLSVIDIDTSYLGAQNRFEDFSEYLKYLKEQFVKENNRNFIVYSNQYQQVSRVFSFIYNVSVRPVEKLLKHKFFVENFMETIQLIKGKERSLRKHIRINLFPQSMYKVIFNRLTEPGVYIDGFIKDLSVAGIGIILANKLLTPIFAVDEKIHIELHFPTNIIEIKWAVIKRIDLSLSLLGIHFDFSNHKEISRKNSEKLNDIIFSLLKKNL